MTDSERQQILKMIDEGKISADEGLKLLQALDEVPLDEDRPAALPEDHSEAQSAHEPATFGEADETREERHSFFAAKTNRFRRLWLIPLTAGVVLTVAAAYWMFAALERSGLGFWFFCAGLPFVLGVAVMTLAFSSRTSRWMYVNVRQKPGESPSRIVITFPISLVNGLFGLFGNWMPEGERESVNLVLDAFHQSVSSDEPILVEADDDGEQVQVYIG